MLFLRSSLILCPRRLTAPGTICTAVSDLGHAPIDGEIYTGDVRSFIGGKEQNCGCNFLRFTSATEWNLGNELGRRLLGLLRSEACFFKCWGLDWSGTDRIHADFAVFQFHSPATREATHSRLGCGVDGKGWQSHHIRNGRIQNDRPSIFEKGKGFLHCKELPFRVEVEGFIEMSFGGRLDRCDFTPACIYEEYVDVTVFLFHHGIEPVQVLYARYVACDCRDVFSN